MAKLSMELGTLVSVVSPIVAAMIGAIVGAASKTWLENRRSIFKRQPAERRNLISGHWTGRVDQAEGPGGVPIDFEIEFHLKLRPDRQTIAGHAAFVWSGNPIQLDVTGGYIDDHYLKVDFEDADPNVLRYGTMIFEVSPHGTELDGDFVGYAAEKAGRIHGTIHLVKKKK